MNFLPKFKNAGYKIDITPWRDYDCVVPSKVTPGSFVVKRINQEFTPEQHRVDSFLARKLLPNGGSTVVVVTDVESDFQFRAVSRCHRNDNYKKSVGVETALASIYSMLYLAEGYTPKI
jgi:hypothetical protein